jgi:hypothetical protein
MAYITLEMMATHADAPGAEEQAISVWTGSKPCIAGTMAC